MKEVRLEVNVKNRGEDAHEATVLVTLPSALNYLGVLRGDTVSGGKGRGEGEGGRQGGLSSSLGSQLPQGATGRHCEWREG